MAAAAEHTITPTSQAKAWVMVRTSAKAPWVSLPLPITLGSAASNDILVNGPTLAPLSKLVYSEEGLLKVYDVKSGQTGDPEELSIFQLQLLGPYYQHPQKMGGLRRLWTRLCLEENRWFSRSTFGKRLPRIQSLRLGLYGSVVTLLLFALVFDPEPKKLILDLSTQALDITFNSIAKVKLGSESADDPYAKGISFATQINQDAVSKQYVMSLGLMGLDQPKEFSITVNEKYIGDLQPRLNCVDQFCNIDLRLPDGVMQAGKNLVALRHNAPESTYRIQYVFLRGMAPATAEHQEQVARLFASAQRYYDERLLLVHNIRLAREALEEASNIQSTHFGLDEFGSKIRVLREQIEQSFEQISRDQQFQLKKALQLGQFSAASEHVQHLLKLFPDPTSAEYEQLQSVRKKIEAKLGAKKP